ncbi:hypothetical protein HPP92_005073 [Vanilla planifolia]|uniref:Uncharacterized protein n=1 Tax=Vanilla planifolia TaxID=51239 RepID=A0A835RG58_VANPL|nr:hypothetical protein HPP92_005073 [Vanilla planifolia]
MVTGACWRSRGKGGLLMHNFRVEAGIGVAGWVESDECVAACGLDRRTLGISSDTLRNVRFLHSLCSPQCSKKCRNIHDLYFNVAAGEGIFLPQLCQANVRRRQMVETGGSSDSAPAPTSWTMNFGRKLIGDDAASAPSSTMGIDNDDDAAWAPVASTTMGTYNVDGAKEGLSLP